MPSAYWFILRTKAHSKVFVLSTVRYYDILVPCIGRLFPDLEGRLVVLEELPPGYGDAIDPVFPGRLHVHLFQFRQITHCVFLAVVRLDISRFGASILPQ